MANGIINTCNSFDVVEKTITSNGRYVNEENIDIFNIAIHNKSIKLTIDDIGIYNPYDYMRVKPKSELIVAIKVNTSVVYLRLLRKSRIHTPYRGLQVMILVLKLNGV